MRAILQGVCGDDMGIFRVSGDNPEPDGKGMMHDTETGVLQCFLWMVESAC